MMVMVVMCVELLGDDDAHIFLLVLYKLTPQLNSTTAVHSSDVGVAEDSDSDDQAMDVDDQV